MHALARKLDLPVRAATPGGGAAEADAAGNRKPFLLQSYRCDMGGGQFPVMEDLSAPIMVKGRHWGAFRFGLKV